MKKIHNISKIVTPTARKVAHRPYTKAAYKTDINHSPGPEAQASTLTHPLRSTGHTKKDTRLRPAHLTLYN